MASCKFVFALAVVGVAYAQVGYDLPAPSAPGYSYEAPDLRAEASMLEEHEDPLARLAALIPGGGVPGENYPILASVPDTGFACEDQEFPGYFADISDESGCQVFHVCQFDGRLDSFLCPNGTLFNQQYFVCDWWYNVDCAASEQFFARNVDIGRILEEDTEASSRSDVVAPNQLYGPPEAREEGLPAPAPAPSQFYKSPSRF